MEDTSAYMDIPYYTDNPAFYDNWAYKVLNREEMPANLFNWKRRKPVDAKDDKGDKAVEKGNIFSTGDDSVL